MLILSEIAQWLKIDLGAARPILDRMELNGVDFSEASTAPLKREAKAAQKELANV